MDNQKNTCGKITKKEEKAYNKKKSKRKRGKTMIRRLRGIKNRNRCCSRMEINLEQLEKMTEQGATLVDVRSPQEFQEGHLENAILLPEYEIRKSVSQVLPDKEPIIIVYCNTGHRGLKAQAILQNLGYKQVYNLCHGLENYN